MSSHQFCPQKWWVMGDRKNEKRNRKNMGILDVTALQIGEA